MGFPVAMAKLIHEVTPHASKFLGATNPSYSQGRPDSPDYRILQKPRSANDRWINPNRPAGRRASQEPSEKHLFRGKKVRPAGVKGAGLGWGLFGMISILASTRSTLVEELRSVCG